jgi:ribosomal protein S24E
VSKGIKTQIYTNQEVLKSFENRYPGTTRRQGLEQEQQRRQASVVVSASNASVRLRRV